MRHIHANEVAHSGGGYEEELAGRDCGCKHARRRWALVPGVEGCASWRPSISNTASCGGFPGLSDSFGAALWGVDYGMIMAFNNFSQALLHVGGVSDTYNVCFPRICWNLYADISGTPASRSLVRPTLLPPISSH